MSAPLFGLLALYLARFSNARAEKYFDWLNHHFHHRWTRCYYYKSLSDSQNDSSTRTTPLIKNQSRAKMKAAVVSPCPRLEFRQVYGWLGLPMLLVFLVSAAWTAALAITQLDPSAVANYLMGTTPFDFGQFWLLPKPDLAIAIPAAVLLLLLAIGYVGLALLMLFPNKIVDWQSRHLSRGLTRVQPNADGELHHKAWFTVNYDVRVHAAGAVVVPYHNSIVLCRPRHLRCPSSCSRH